MTNPIVRPTNLTIPFAFTGGKNAIPTASQIGITPGAASLTDGFPPVTRIPIVAGGTPPAGLDMNGILYTLSLHSVFAGGGQRYRFDAALATAIGGYPVGTVLQSNDGLSEYLNILAANSTDFNSTPASIGVSWIPYAGSAAGRSVTVLADTGAANAYTAVNAPPLAALPTTSGLVQVVSIANSNTTASTYAPDGLPVRPIYDLGINPLSGGELAALGLATFMYVVAATVNSGNGGWILMSCTGGAQRPPPGVLLRTTVITTSGTWTKGAGTNAVDVEVLGGGGGGGGCAATGPGTYTSSSGGAAGGYTRKLIQGVASPTTVAIGAGGAGGIGAAAGTGGGTSSFGAYCSATGGAVGNNIAPSGVATVASGVAGGTGSGGDLDVPGMGSSSAWSSAAAMLGVGSNGGSGRYGAGGLATVAAAGGVATGYGSGGGGVFQGDNAPARTGGAGTPGVVIIREYT